MARPGPGLWPREHGAYAQLGVALAAALALVPRGRALALAVAAAAAFLGSEPLLVLLGHRGEPAPGLAGSAGRRLAALGVLAAACAWAAWRSLPLARLAALVPAGALGLALFGLFLARRERTALGELLAAWTFAAGAGAVAAAGGAPGPGFRLALILAALFTLGTAIVHGHLLALRRGGAPAPRLAAFLGGAALTVLALGLGRRGLLPGAASWAFLPMTLAGLVMWLAPPAPRRLKGVGWTAAACALAGAALAVAGLTGT